MTDIKDDLRQILYSPTLKRLSFSVLPIKSLAASPGTLIAKQGDPPDGFYIILAGKTEWTRKVARSSRCNPGGRGYFR